MNRIASAGKMAFGALATTAAGFGVGAIVGGIAKINIEYQKLNAMLVTSTGTQAQASKEMARLQAFAKTTPYSLAGVTEAFIKLKNMGLEPSNRALKSYGNTASAMGKDLMQMIEAVADATTGEFERLKEFGIKSAKEGNKVKFTFQGVSTTVGDSAKEIEDYLLKIGETKFGQGMDLQAKTLGGALSNLGDTVAQLAVKFGEAGFNAALQQAIKGLEAGAGSLENFATKMGYLTGTALAGTINALTFVANNFNTLAYVIGTVAFAAVGRLAAVLVGQLAAGFIAVSNAMKLAAFSTAMTASMTGMSAVAVTATTALARLRVAGSALLGVFGGPWGIALAAAAGGILYLGNKSAETSQILQGLTGSLTTARTAYWEARERAGEAAVAVTASGEAGTIASSIMGGLTTMLNTAANAYRTLGFEAKKAALDMALANAQVAGAKVATLRSNIKTDYGDRMFAGYGPKSPFQRGWLKQKLGMGQSEEELKAGLSQAQAEERIWRDTARIIRNTNASKFVTKPGGNPPAGSGGGAGGKGGGKGGGGGGGQDPLKVARDRIDALKFEMEQLERTDREQAIYNELKQAAIAPTHALGVELAKLTGDLYDARGLKEYNKWLQEIIKSEEDAVRLVGLTGKARIEEEFFQEVRKQRPKTGATTNGDDIVVTGRPRLTPDEQAALDAKLGRFTADQAQAALEARQQKEKEWREASLKAEYDAWEERKRHAGDFGNRMADITTNFMDGLIFGTTSFKDAMTQAITDIGKLMLEELVYRPLREMIVSGITQMLMNLAGGGSGFGNAMSSWGAGGINIGSWSPGTAPGAIGMALGGRQEAGRPYWVGERGPELHVPDRGGVLLPNYKVQGQGGGVTVNVDARGSTNPAETKQLVMEGIAAAMPMITEASKAKTMKHLMRRRMN